MARNEGPYRNAGKRGGCVNTSKMVVYGTANQYQEIISILLAAKEF